MTVPGEMRLQVITPTKRIVDERVTKIIAEASNGSFALLPRHVDFVAPLVPGVLTYTTFAGADKYLGIDDGFLVKCAGEVSVATRRAAAADDLAELHEHVKSKFETRTAGAIAARSALARLELSLIRRFIELEHRP